MMNFFKLPNEILTLWLLTITTLIVVIVFAIAMNDKDAGTYDFCVEWDGWIHIENLVPGCYDFEKQEFVCGWEIQKDGSLNTQRIINSSGWRLNATYPGLESPLIKTYQCSKYVKSITIKK